MQHNTACSFIIHVITLIAFFPVAATLFTSNNSFQAEARLLNSNSSRNLIRISCAENLNIDDISSPGSLLRLVKYRRRQQTKQALDVSRDHLQIMFVDDCGTRARLLEGLTEKIAIWWDGGWWVYPFSSSVGNINEKSKVDHRVFKIAQSLGLDKRRSIGACCALVKSDLDSYDIIVAVDGSTKSKIVRLLDKSMSNSAFHFYDDKIRVLSDFIDYDISSTRLDSDLRYLVAPYKKELEHLADIPYAYISKSQEYRRMTAAFVLGCAGLVRFLMDIFEEYYDKRRRD